MKSYILKIILIGSLNVLLLSLYNNMAANGTCPDGTTAIVQDGIVYCVSGYSETITVKAPAQTPLATLPPRIPNPPVFGAGGGGGGGGSTPPDPNCREGWQGVRPGKSACGLECRADPPVKISFLPKDIWDRFWDPNFGSLVMGCDVYKNGSQVKLLVRRMGFAIGAGTLKVIGSKIPTFLSSTVNIFKNVSSDFEGVQGVLKWALNDPARAGQVQSAKTILLKMIARLENEASRLDIPNPTSQEGRRALLEGIAEIRDYMWKELK